MLTKERLEEIKKIYAFFDDPIANELIKHAEESIDVYKNGYDDGYKDGYKDGSKDKPDN